MDKQIAVAKGVGLGLVVTLTLFPILGLLADTSWGFVAKTLMLLMVPGILITTRDSFSNTEHLVLYALLGIVQIIYWVVLSLLWLRLKTWRKAKR